jgi:GntR family transcriptional regulator/MocR family aminotransferase
VDLYLAVGPHPRRAALERELRAGIRQGRLRPGAPLPSTRALAAELEISRGTVVEAYAQLVAEGWLTARQGAATIVASAVPAIAAPAHPVGGRNRPDRSPDPRYDLRTGRPDLSKFPRRAWGQAMTAAVRGAPDAVLDYGDPRGLEALRSALVDHLGRTRGVLTRPGCVVICSGTSAGLPLLWRALRRRGVTRIAVEDPSWFEHARTARAEGLTPLPIAVDAHGLVVDDQVATDAGAVLTTPAHQFPTGVVLAPERRASLGSGHARREG